MDAPDGMAFDEIRGAESGVRAVKYTHRRATNASDRGAAKCGCLLRGHVLPVVFLCHANNAALLTLSGGNK
jgi:hypothetical protein